MPDMLRWYAEMVPAFYAEAARYRPEVDALNRCLEDAWVRVRVPRLTQRFWRVECLPASVTGTTYTFDAPSLPAALRMAWRNLVPQKALAAQEGAEG